MSVRIKKVIEIDDWEAFLGKFVDNMKSLDLPEELVVASINSLKSTLESEIK